MSDASPADRARDLLAFIDEAPTPYHAVAAAAARLSAAGFAELDERERWGIEAGGRYFIIKGGGTLVAFVAGDRPPAESGFLLIGAHTDSPNLRVKPLADLVASGTRQLSVEVYGGVLWSTWLDRDLALGGRVSLRDGSSRLLRVTRPVCRIPNVAIHLNREVNSAGLQLNPQSHLLPLFSLDGKAEDARLLPMLVSELSRDTDAVTPEQILGFDLCLFDTQPSAIGGARGELIFAPRLDNLASCHAAICALLESGDSAPLTRVVALYDHEEVGSQSAAGARSRFLGRVLERIAGAYSGGDTSWEVSHRALARSLLVSADMAHALHPNYGDKHDKLHAPRLGAGPVIKVNANQSYATDGPSTAFFAAACRDVGVTPQYFTSRNDMPCGSTIGPISAAMLGLRTVDVGSPMHSMHSCREGAAVADVEPMIRVLTHVLKSPELPPPRD